MLISHLAYRIDTSSKNAWKIYLTDGPHIRRRPIGRVVAGSQGYWAECVYGGMQELVGPFQRMESAAKVVAQRSYELRGNLLSLTATAMPLA